MEKQPMNIKTRQCDVSAEGLCDSVHALCPESFSMPSSLLGVTTHAEGLGHG